MDKIKIGIIIAIIIAVIIAVLEIYNRSLMHSAPATFVEQFEQNLNPNDIDLPAPPVKVNNQNEVPNALDVMAPGYKKAQERLNNVKDLREKGIEIQKQDLEKFN